MDRREAIEGSTDRFSDRVDDYVRYRPTYPAGVIDCLRAEFSLRPEYVVADVGSGTGIFCEQLLANGNSVFGVEPNGPMRAAAERLLGPDTRFRSIAGTAESTTLPDASVDWVTAAQAFHWFDVDRCRREFHRILRPAGRVALLWNNRLEYTPFLRAFEALLHEYAIDYARVKHQGVESDGSIERFFGPAGFELRRFENRQSLDFNGLRGRTLSASYMPRSGHARFDAMNDALRRLFDEYAESGRVKLEYETRLYVGGRP